MKFSAIVSYPALVALALALAVPGLSRAQVFIRGSNPPLPYPSVTAAGAVGDFNHDGNPDLAIADRILGCYAGNRIFIFIGRGDGTFARVDTATPGGPYRMIVADVDGDSHHDLLLGTTRCQEGNPGLSEAFVVLIRGDGSGAFLPPISVSTGQEFLSAVADYNDDGKLDFVAGSVFLAAGSVVHPFIKTSQTIPLAVDATDLNQDGIVDLVGIVQGESGDSLAVFLGNGDGTFQAQSEHPIGYQAASLSFADFDNDEILDVLVAFDHSYHPDSFGVLLGKGDASFEDITTFPLIPMYHAFAIADFNRDGHADVAVTQNTSSSGTLGVLLGRGDGSLRQRMDHPIVAWRLVAADWNRDGRPDLASYSVGGSTVDILLNSVGLGLTATGSASATVVAGGTATFGLTLGGAGLDGAAAMTCSGAPRGTTCSVTSPVSFDAITPTPVSVTIATTAPTNSSQSLPFPLESIPLLAGLIAGIYPRRWWRRSWMTAVVCGGILTLASCGAGSSPPQANPNATPPGTYELQVTATTASESQSIALTLIVQ